MNSNQNKELELFKMKVVATGLLVISFTVFIVASFLEEQYPWVGFIRAVAEAATVGAIADWFAVTALFRHPFGLPIPHTAIIPHRKQLIAANFGRFVREKFLSEGAISQKLQEMDITRQAATWLSQPDNSTLVADRIAENIAAAAKVMRDDDVQNLLEGRLAHQIRATNFAPMMGNLMGLVMSGNRKQEIFSFLVQTGADFLKENKEVVIQKINAELPLLVRGFDRRIYRHLVEGVDNTLQEVNQDPHHPLQENFQGMVERYIDELKHSPDILSKEQLWKEELLQHPAFTEFSSSLWQDIKTSLMEPRPDSDLRPTVQQAVANFADRLLDDPVLFEKVDRWLHEAVIYLIKTYGHEVESLITGTIERWDSEQASREIELQVGRDLQFIRINGTVIGGVAGLAIYTISFLVKWGSG